MIGPDLPHDTGPGPSFHPDAGAHLDRGRALLDAGQRPAAMQAFRAAAGCDPRSYLCDWGVLPYLKAERRAHLPRRMKARVESWHLGNPPEAVGELPGLSYKPRLMRWAKANGFRTPARIAQAPCLEALDWAGLPRDYVLKPANGASNAGVIVARDGVDQFKGLRIGPDAQGYAAARWVQDGVRDAAVLVEEAILDVDRAKDPELRLPRDIKVFAVNGQAAFFRIFDRNGEGAHRSRATFDRYGAWIDDPSDEWEPPANRMPATGFAEAVALGERLSRIFPWLVRFDFYCADDGPILGEITTNPNAGKGFQGVVRRALLQMWEAYPDPPATPDGLPV